MLSTNSACFVSIPNPQNKRVLIPGRVSRLEENRAFADFDESIAVQDGSELTLYAEWRGKFYQQPARLVSRSTADGATIVEIERLGEPVNCESRSIYRVSVASQGLFAIVDRQSNCVLTDISSEGVSIIARKPLEVGRAVKVMFTVEGTKIDGELRVQTEKKLANGTLRYGLYAAEKRSALRKGLETLSIQLQRLQLRRLSAA